MLVYSPEEEEEFFDQIDQVYTLTEEGNTEEAEKLLLELESSIMDPKENCSVGAIMLDSIYAFYDQTGNIEKALPYFLNETAFLTEKLNSDSVKNPVHFITTGSIYYALEDLDKAREYFKMAYQAGKKALFSDFHADFLFMALASDADFAEFKENFVPDLEEEEDELTDEQQELMDEYCEKGNAEMEEEHFNVAADYFKKAYAVLPDPKDEWEATGYITASLGDAYYNAKKYKEAKEQLLIAAKFYETGENPNPFVLLRLGAACMELGEEEQALAHLLEAYEMEGTQLFEEDKKYLSFLKKHHKLD
jgi:tetratricopeptide (TPR) repeat protein